MLLAVALKIPLDQLTADFGLALCLALRRQIDVFGGSAEIGVSLVAGISELQLGIGP